MSEATSVNSPTGLSDSAQIRNPCWLGGGGGLVFPWTGTDKSLPLYCNMSILYKLCCTTDAGLTLHPCVALLCWPIKAGKDREASQQCASSAVTLLLSLWSRSRRQHQTAPLSATPTHNCCPSEQVTWGTLRQRKRRALIPPSRHVTM